MSVYDRLAGRAASLIGRYGRQATVIRPPAPATSAWDAPRGKPARLPCLAIRTEFSASEVNGTSVLRGDVRFVLDSLSVEPELGDSLEFDGQTWQIVPPARSVSPAGTPVVYIVQGRA